MKEERRKRKEKEDKKKEMQTKTPNKLDIDSLGKPSSNNLCMLKTV